MDILKVILLLCACILDVQCAWSSDMENPKLWQGDIELDPDEDKIGGTHKFVSIKGRKWPDGRIPYVMEDSIGDDGYYAIKYAIQNYHKYTCLRFHKRTTEKSYISFRIGKGCSSPIGYRHGRVNYIKLAPGCWNTGTVMHEIGHTLGLFHEQARPDRDKYIRVLYENIISGMEYNFDKKSTSMLDPLATPYDYSSMMHYGESAFGVNHKITIQTIDPSKQILIGQREGFSELDIKQLGIMYDKICKGDVGGSTGGGTGGGKGGTIATTISPCRDVSPRCPKYAALGRCNNSRWLNWMHKYCCSSCHKSG